MAKNISFVIGVLTLGIQACSPVKTGEIPKIERPTITPGNQVTPTGEEICESCIDVPVGSTPIIDGEISPGEWEDSWIGGFSDESKLFLKINDGYLYLGIQADTNEMIAGNVFLNRGDEIFIFHSSAALGTAIYKDGGSYWTQMQPFSWRCRGIGGSEVDRNERDEFFESNGWLAANARMGKPNEQEFKIFLTDGVLKMAVNFIEGSKQDSKTPWPIGLNDDVILPTPGGFPLEMDFNPSYWGLLQFGMK